MPELKIKLRHLLKFFPDIWKKKILAYKIRKVLISTVLTIVKFLRPHFAISAIILAIY
jgi:hypothetical protein